MHSLNGNRSILKMSTQIRINVQCTEYYEQNLNCELPYQFTKDDIEDIYTNGYGEVVLELTKNASKEFIKLTRRENMFAPNDWKTGSGSMHLRFPTPTDWDFDEVHAQEWDTGELKVELVTHHDSMECYDVEHIVNDWEEEL